MLRIHPLLRLGACALLSLLGTQARADAAADTAAAEAADRQALLQAWEKQQKNDPLTVTFEQTAPGTYHLKTIRFPYDGSVRISAIVIHQIPLNSPLGATKYGAVEPTLDQDNDKLESQHPNSFPDWSARNTFYYKPEAKSWISQADMHFEQGPNPAAAPRFNPFFSFSLLLGSMALIAVALAILRVREWRAVQKRIKQAEAAEKRVEEIQQRMVDSRERTLKAYALQEENHKLVIEQTRLLQEILETLKQAKQ